MTRHRRRHRPQLAATAIQGVVASGAPRTPLAAVQTAWRDAVGPQVADRAQPVSERDGVVAVSCESATWAQELDLMRDAIRDRVNAALGASEKGFSVRDLRFSADAARHRN